MKKSNGLSVKSIVFLTAVLTILTLSSCINIGVATSSSENNFIFDLDALKEEIQNSPDECWKKPAQNRMNTICNKIDELQELIDQGDFEKAYDKLLYDIKPKLTGLKTDENEEPFGNGEYNQPWVICSDLQSEFCDECNLILSEINPQSIYDDDKIPPVISLVYVGGNYIDNPGVWHVYVEDLESGLDEVIIEINGIVEIHDINLQGAISMVYENLPLYAIVGDNTIVVTATNNDKDFIGDQETSTEIELVVIKEPTPPLFSIDYVGGNIDNNPGVWNVDINDPEEGLKYVEISVDGIIEIQDDLGGITNIFYAGIVVPSVSDDHVIEVFVENMDNYATQETDIVTIIDDDISGPFITVDYVNSQEIFAGWWNVYIEDLESGIDDVNISIDGITSLFEGNLGGIQSISYSGNPKEGGTGIPAPGTVDSYELEVITHNNDKEWSGDQESSTESQTDEILYNDEDIVIIRDNYGIPHIYATTKEGLAFGCGYAKAQDRLWQADIYRRSAYGSLAEFSLASINSDYNTRSIGYSKEELREIFDNWEPTQPEAHLKEMMLAYVEGVNLYIAEAQEALASGDPSLIPIEYLPGVLTPDGLLPIEPWVIEDSVAIMSMMAWRFGGTGGNELQYLAAINALQREYGDEIGWDIFNDLFPQNDPGAEVTIPGTGCSDPQPYSPSIDPGLLDNIGEVYQEYEEAKMGQTELFESLGLPTKFGSSAWLVSPEKSTTGNALMVGGPQMGQSIPQIVMEVGMHGAGINAVGMMMPFAPFILIGVSEYGAWTSTTGGSDVMDTYIEVLNPANHSEYLYNGQFIPMEKRIEKIYGYKKSIYVLMDVYRTVHGPIIAKDEDNHLAFSMKTPFYKNDLAAEEGWTLFQQARNISEFENACKTIQPSHNFFWIDKRGNIGYWHTGTFPIKPTTGTNGRSIDDRFPLWGTGQEEWVGLTDFDEMPRCINPEQGWLANWNNKPVANWPYAETDAGWGEGHRVKRIMDLLATEDEFSFEDMNTINMDAAYNHINGMNYLHELIAAAQTSSDPEIMAALLYLEAWNHHYNDLVDPQWPAVDATYDDPGLRIFDEWFNIIDNEVFDDDLPPGVRASSSTLLHVFDGPNSKLQLNYDYFNGEDKTEVIIRVLKWAIGNLTEELGPDMATWLTPVRRIWFRQQGALPGPLMHYMNRGTYNQIVEMPTSALPHAENVLPPGQSGFMNYLFQYKHTYDQLALYENWMYKPVLFLYKEILKVAESEKILKYYTV